MIVLPDEKMALAILLSLDGKPWIPKLGKTEKRPLGIPTIKEFFYGFRPGRSAHDAIEAIFNILHSNRPKWVFGLLGNALSF